MSPGSFRISRRGFLQGGIATPLLAKASFAGASEHSEIDLSFVWNDDRTRLSVIPVIQALGTGNTGLVGAPRLPMPEDLDLPANPAPEKPLAWELATESFGPDARFVLRRRGAQGLDLGGYTLRVINASMGRVTGRQFEILFRRFPERATGEGKEVIRTRFRVSGVTGLWSSMDSPSAVKSFSLGVRDPQNNLVPGPEGAAVNLVLLRQMITAQVGPNLAIGPPPQLSQIITVGQVENTFRLLFNGVIGFGGIKSSALVRVDFGYDCNWTVKVPLASSAAIAMRLLNRDIAFRTFTFGWSRPTKDAAGPEPAWKQLHVQGNSADVQEQDINLGGTSGPRAVLRPSIPCSIHLRAVTTGDQTDSSAAAPATYLTEAGLVLRRACLLLSGVPTEALGELDNLQLRLLARVSAPPTFAPGEPVEHSGTLTIDGHAEDAAAAKTVTSPIGNLEIAVLAERETKAEDAKEPALDERAAVFAARVPRPVLIAQSWKAGRRDRPTTDWIELHARLTRAELALPDAEFSRLQFEPTDLLIHYAPQGLAEEPLTSVLRLGDVSDRVRARLDLTRATLWAGRGTDLLSLKFRFTDISLVCRGPVTELVALSPRCLSYGSTERVVSGRSETPAPPIPDVRPILVVEFPPQHLLESALAIPNDPEPPDIKLNPSVYDVNLTEPDLPVAVGSDTKELPAKGWVRVDLNDRASVVEALLRMPDVKTRRFFRRQIQIRKSQLYEKPKVDTTEAKDAIEFRSFAGKASKDLASIRPPLPWDQLVYIGPFALDPDALGAMRKLARSRASDMLKTQLEKMCYEVRRQAAAILKNAGAGPDPVATASPLALAGERPASGLMLESLLESAVPAYAEFRTWYRDRAIRLSENGVSADAPPSLEAAEIEVFWQALPTKDVEPPPPAWASGSGKSIWDDIARRIRVGWLEYIKDLSKPPQPMGLSEGRLSGPTRLAYRIRCRDGLVAGRLTVRALDHSPNLVGEPADPATMPDRPGLRRERFDFTLQALTSFGDMDLSVVRRAERIYAPDQAGRVDPGSRRTIQLNSGGMLDHLGFRSGEALTSSERLADIQASMGPPGPTETWIEIPSRLVLSPHQEATFLTRRPVPEGIFDLAPGVAGRPVPLWSADLVTDGEDPGLRAVYSPDMVPDFVWGRLYKAGAIPAARTESNAPPFTLPFGHAPLRGPWAPWLLGREETGLPIPGARDVALATGDEDLRNLARTSATDEAFCQAIETLGSPETQRHRIATLIAYLCGRGRKGDLNRRLFRAPMDARDRHELVVLTALWGLPVVGRRSPTGGLVDASGQVEPDRIDQLIDIFPGSAIYIPRTLDVTELSLTSLGGTFRQDTMFEPPAAARRLSGDPLFDALSIERWRQWTVLGRDIVTEILYKGFLFPLGHRASLVKLTERTFFHDMGASPVYHHGVWARPIRAYLNQRLFIRVGKPEKTFSAVGQPLAGRMWPPRKVTITTRETPDLTDPTADYPTAEQTAGQTAKTLGGGRIDLGNTTGLAFWPRTARTELATQRFDLKFDAVATDMPLIFVDNVLANDPTGLRDLTKYYNTVTKASLRTVRLGGNKLRYADERESGSASVETESWELAVSGGETATAEPMGDRIKLNNADFIFSPVLQGADQPPFYPLVNRAQVYLRQTEKLTGQSFGPVPARFDGAYLRDGLPAIGDETPGARSAEMYLAVLLKKQLDLGDGGDRAGGIVRPDARPIGLSRARGVLTWGQSNPPVFNDGPEAWEDISRRFKVKNSATDQTKGDPPPSFAATADTAATVAASAFAETKLLGTIKMSKLLSALKKLQDSPALGEAVSELTEHVRYGVESLPINEIVTVVRDSVILPLSEVASKARALWADAAEKVAMAQPPLANGDIPPVNLSELFPELDAGLSGFDMALKETLRQDSPIAFSLSLGAVYETGRRLIDAVARTLSNPVERFEFAFKSRIAEIRAILDAVSQDLPALFTAILKEQLNGVGDQLIFWLKTNINWKQLPKIRFFAPASLTEGLDQKLAEQIETALKPLDWDLALLEPLVLGFAGHVFKSLTPGAAQPPARDLFKAYLGSSAKDSKLPDPDTTPPDAAATVRDWLIAQTLGKLEKAEANLQALLGDVIDQIRAEIAEIKALLKKARDEAIDWAIERLVEEFWRELLVIEVAFQIYGETVAALESGDLGLAAQSIIRFVEIFTGPLGIDLGAECRRLLQPLALALSGVHVDALNPIPRGRITVLPVKTIGKFDIAKPPSPAPIDLYAQLGALHDLSAEAEAKISEALVKAEQIIPPNVKAMDAIQDALKNVEEARKSVGAIRASTEALILGLAKDALTGRALDTRIAEFIQAFSGNDPQGFCANLNPEALKPYRHIAGDLADFLGNRQLLASEIANTATTIARAVGQLTENSAVQAAFGLAALAAALKVAGIDESDIKDLQDEAKALAEAYDRRIAAAVIHALDWALGRLEDVAIGLATLRNSLLAAYEDLLAPYLVIEGLRRNLAQIDTYLAALDQTVKAIGILKELTPGDPFEAGAPANPDSPDLKALSAAFSVQKLPDGLQLFDLSVKPGALTLAGLAQIDKAITDQLMQLEALAKRIVVPAFSLAEDAVDDVVKWVLDRSITIAGKGLTLAALYKEIATVRDKFVAGLKEGTGGLFAADIFQVTLDKTREAALGDNPDDLDALGADAKLLQKLYDTERILADATLRDYLVLFLREWGRGDATPLRLGRSILDLARKLIRDDILRLVDLNRLREEVEERIKALLPVEVTLKHSFAITLEDGPVKEATAGLLQPQGNPQLAFGSEVRINPFSDRLVTFAAKGSLGQFDIKLVGNYIDALTLRFAGARFSAGTGQKARFEVDYLGHKVGPALQFVEKLSAILNPGAGSGPYLTPTIAPLGIQAGYRLDVGAFSLGAVAFDNIKLDCSVILPFEDADARFRASLSSRDSPFTISYLPWGGSGFFSIEANPDGIVAMELQFEFGGAAIFRFGPLTGRGRAMAGLYVKTITQDGRRITEIQATFYVGGSAKIWIFSFGASLLVRMGQVNGNMTGEAVFTYNFSIGIKDFEFSVKIRKKEEQGYSGGSSSGSTTPGMLGKPRRYAQEGAFGSTGVPRKKLTQIDPQIDTTTRCQGEDWSTYSRYFQPFKSKGFF